MTTVSEWVQGALALLRDPVEDGLGALPLADFQQTAARRLLAIVERYGGALLADGVGLGKTRVCLAVAKTLVKKQRITGARGAIWLMVPSKTVDQWRATASILGLEGDAIRVVTHAAVSRGRLPDASPLVVVIDEAHRFRNRRTQKRRTLESAPRAPMLLATATPVVNSTDDLQSLLELFVDDADARAVMGCDLATSFESRGGEVDVTELLREVIVRRLEPPEGKGFGNRPRARLQVVEYEPPEAEAWIWHNLESELSKLELTALGGEWPRGLFVEHVLRRWESGPAALADTLEEIVDYHERWLDAARHGSRLDRAAFRALFGENTAQMVFQFLFEGPSEPPGAEEMSCVEGDCARLQVLLDRSAEVLREGTGRDLVVIELARQAGKLLVFTSYRCAAHGLFVRLREALGARARVGLVTGSEARATGLGRTTSQEVLRRFAPRAAAVDRLPREHESLRILIATDCLAEGVNLQDCGRVVLADLPYTPVGVEQRVGRLLRPGGPHPLVNVYLPRPARWNDSLGMRRRLDAKLGQAERAGVGSDSVIAGPGVEPANPYAALTALDDLSLQLDGEEGDEEVKFDVPVGVVSSSGVARVIAMCRVREGERARPWIFGLDPDGKLEPLAEILPRLVELAYDPRELAPESVPPAVEAAVEARRAFLEGSRLGPPPLDLDAPEVQAWRRLCDGIDDPALLDDLRARLLHRQRSGVRAALTRLARPTSPLARLVRYVATLPPRGEEPVEIEVLACLRY